MDKQSVPQLFQLFDSIYPMTAGLKAALEQHIELISLHKKDLLIKEGQSVRYIYFITEGIVRMYYLHDGKEITTRINKEGDVIFSIDAFYNNSAETVNIEAVENVQLARLSFDVLSKLFNEFLELNYIARVLSDRYIIDYERRLHILRKLTAKEKWQFFCTHYPELSLRVPLIYIAGFLGMNMETLSRARKV